jgi:folate-binding protein YgfZ
MSFVTQQETLIGESDELRSELHSLVSGCAAYKLDHTLVSLSGRDRTRWLNGMVSNNIRDLPSGHGVYAFVLNPQGQIQGDLYAFHRGETLVVEIDRSQASLLPQLRRYIIMDKVEVEELGDRVQVFGAAGPGADQVLSALGLTPPSAALELSDATWNGMALTVVRGDNPCVPNFELWVAKDQTDQAWHALLEAGAREIHNPTLETFRVLCGIPRVGTDIRERTLPPETAQDRALNFNKGCYIGQEIVERIRARGSVHRVLTGLEVNGPVPVLGAPIQLAGKDVGFITSTATVPAGGGVQVIALGFVRKEHLTDGVTFDVAESKASLVSLPFSRLLQQL